MTKERVKVSSLIIILSLLLLLSAVNSFGKEPMYIYSYKHPVLKKVGVFAWEESEAFKKAARECFKAMNGKWATEEEALEIIDVCANPIKMEKRED
jgi:hypothetical protein